MSVATQVEANRRAVDSRWNRLMQDVSARTGELKLLAGLLLAVVALVLLPGESERVRNAAAEAIAMGHDYAREHVVLCLVPALFIAGAIGVFVRQSDVLRLLGPKANKPLAYAVASISGAILSVCSCTVLPLFAGIWRMGAGLGPAIAFLFSGPAINVLAIVLTARVLGLELGLARAIGAVSFSVVIGLLMALVFRRDAAASIAAAGVDEDHDHEPLLPGVLLLVSLVAILVFANWSTAERGGLYGWIGALKWWLTAGAAVLLAVVLDRWFDADRAGLVIGGIGAAIAAWLFPTTAEVAFLVATGGLVLSLALGGERARQWLHASWEFTKQIVPLLLAGVLVAGFLLGRPGHEALMPSAWVERSVGGSGLLANVFASVAGAFMYFATLTEVPILQGLIGSGMGKGPALALLLAGPALSLPSMLALRQIMGTRKTVVYVALVSAMASLTGWIYGLIA